MIKYTKAEHVDLLSEEDHEKINKKLAGFQKRAMHELTDKEQEDVLKETDYSRPSSGRIRRG